MGKLSIIDRIGVACTFDIRMTKNQFADIWDFEVYSIPRRADNDFFPMSLELQSNGTLKIIAIGGNVMGVSTWPEYSAKGIPMALLAYAHAQLNRDIVSSPTSGGAGIWRTAKATAMWERMRATGNASYDQVTDIYTFIP